MNWIVWRMIDERIKPMDTIKIVLKGRDDRTHILIDVTPEERQLLERISELSIENSIDSSCIMLVTIITTNA